MIFRMWNLASLGVAFNFLIDDGHYDLDIFHYSLSRVHKICENITGTEGKLFYRVLDGEAHFYLYKKIQ